MSPKNMAAALSAALGAAGALAVPPQVSNVTLTQPPHTRRAEVTYETDGPGIATFQFRTNDVDLCHSEVVCTVTGGINMFLPAGAHAFTWDMGRDFPEIVSNLTVEITLWATNHPPEYCAVALVGHKAEARWYGKASEVPFGATNSRWKKDWLLMRQIPSTEGETTTLGAPPGERGSNTNGSDNARLVRITKPFYMGVFEVTQLQWQHISGAVRSKPSSFNNPDDWEERPVETVSYNDIRGATTESPTVDWPATTNYVAPNSFMGLLRKKTDGILAFDLPTDAQWEYACRAGTSGAWNNGTTITSSNNDVNLPLLGRCQLNGGLLPDGGSSLSTSEKSDCDASRGTAKVGSYLPNAWGLYDMHGNVFEWCLDRYSADVALLAGDDPTGPLTGSSRLSRGGRWGNGIQDCRQAFRYSITPSTRNANTGFRVTAPAEVFIGQ